ncbi:uncharacterized protein VTP21DRAFT_2744 [Calcarisporiella thermophila]|uniref:uncharacterized protein n=1 Tax=Calcarisporiella thermophila TaxID=911321 RepID=UPI003741F412
MNDTVSILVAIFVVVVAFRWLMGGDSSSHRRELENSSRTQARRVSPEMINRVHEMFPSIPISAIKYDLQLTGSCEVTCDKILQQGGLPLPPNAQASSSNPPSSTTSSTTLSARISSASNNTTPPLSSLLHRYNLMGAVRNGFEMNEPLKVWESTAEKRDEILRRRKEFMILQARSKFLKQQQEEEKINR